MMALQRRFLPLLAIASALFFFFLYHSTSVRETWRGLPQAVGMGEALSDQQKPTTENSDGEGTPKSEEETNYANWNPRPVFKQGNQKPSDYNFTSILVIPRTKEEDVNWVEEELPNQQTAIYVADDPSAPLHPPKNKGHEVMIYLSWIIENYDDLPDVAIFMHAHRWSWHNDDILDNDSAMMIRRLSLNRVWREGYMNMRCSWNPGCPDLASSTGGLAADAPTDQNGVAYVTFTGAAQGIPGIGVRDPIRKWGHYDSAIPVYVLGFALQGRLTETSPPGSFVLQIKNVDSEGGLDPALNEGERVTTEDIAPVQSEVKHGTYNFWHDFDWDGVVSSADLNLVKAHRNHSCTKPLNP